MIVNGFTKLLLILLFVGCASAERSPQMKKADLLFGKGTNALMKGDFTSALRFLTSASKIDPKRSDIHNNLGMAYYFKKSKRNAFKHIKHAIKLDNKNTEAKSNLASIYLEAGRHKKAQRLYQATLEDLTYDKHFQTYYNLGVISLKQKKISKAIKYFNMSVSENEYSCNALYQLGILSLKRQDYTQAVSNFDQGTNGPCYTSEPNQYYLGLSYQKSGDNALATKTFNQFINKFPNSKYSPLAKKKLSSMGSNVDSNFIYSQKPVNEINQ